MEEIERLALHAVAKTLLVSEHGARAGAKRAVVQKNDLRIK